MVRLNNPILLKWYSGSKVNRPIIWEGKLKRHQEECDYEIGRLNKTGVHVIKWS